MENLVTSPDPQRIRLKPRVNEPHPWFAWNVVEDTLPKPRNGAVVEVENARGKWVGRGFYNGHARIRVRILTRNPAEKIDTTFFKSRIRDAVSWRRELGLLEAASSNSCRLIHSEGDHLSGLIVDRYDDVLAVQFVSAGMFYHREAIKSALAEALQGVIVETPQFYLFADKRIQKQESFDCHESPSIERVVTENGLKYKVAIGSKHKTGFFLDQRENRKKVAKFSKGKKVLDLCCHTGGFSLSSALGGAIEVTGVDLDPESIEIAKNNVLLNEMSPDRVRFVASDLFKWNSTEDAKVDLIVLDPSKQTRSEEGTAQALTRYYEMNRKALQWINHNGILVSCSCSGRISEKEFINALREAAFANRKSLQVFDVTGAAPDHPFLLHVPESRYLKAIWARVV